MAKRSTGEGTWGKKTINGKKYFYHRDADGRWFYGKTQGELKIKVDKAKNEPHCSNLLQSTTISEYTLNWLYKIKKNVLKQQTFDNYELMINRWDLKGYRFKDVLISEIDDESVQKFIDTMVKNKYSLGTIRKNWSILRQTLQYGMAKNEIPRFEFSLISIPTEQGVVKKKKKVAFATIEDLEILYEEAQKEKNNKKFGMANSPYFYGNNAKAIVFIGYTGLRVSELTALRWENVDIENKEITVNSTHAIVKNRDDNDERHTKVITTDPKRYKPRTIPLSKRAMEQIEFFDKYNPKHKKSDYVFLSRDMTPLRKRNIYTTLKRMLSNCEANSDLTIHSLRHGFGSILLNNGVDIKIISELLGHQDIRTTYNIYIGITDEQKHSAINTFD